MTSFRAGHSALRVAKEYHRRRNEISGVPIPNIGGVMCIDTGSQCSLSGVGKIYNDFKRTGSIAGYSGFGSAPVPSAHPNYAEAPYTEVRFRDTFANSTMKCAESEYS